MNVGLKAEYFRDVTKMLPRHPGHQNRKREAQKRRQLSNEEDKR